MSDGVVTGAVVAGASALVAAEVIGAAAVVTGAVAVVELVSDGLVDSVVAVAADVADDGKAAACACRENTSKTASIPAATIATCTARRAMCLKVAWDTSGSRFVGRDRADRPFLSG